MNVYDFDNTIYRGESFVDCFMYYLKRSPWIVKYAPYMVKGVFQYKVGTIRLDEGMAKYARFVEDYVMTIPDMHADLEDFWDKHIHRIKPFYKDVQRDDDLIISASPEILIAEICKRLGINHYLGSTFDPDTGKITRMCFRDNKVKAFLEYCPEGKIDCLYTDSMHDLPLMELSDTVYMVKGEKITRIK